MALARYGCDKGIEVHQLNGETFVLEPMSGVTLAKLAVLEADSPNSIFALGSMVPDTSNGDIWVKKNPNWVKL